MAPSERLWTSKGDSQEKLCPLAQQAGAQFVVNDDVDPQMIAFPLEQTNKSALAWLKPGQRANITRPYLGRTDDLKKILNQGKKNEQET